MRIINLIFRWIIGGVFIASAVAKIGNVQLSHGKSAPGTATASVHAWSWSMPLGESRAIRLSYVPDLTQFAQDVGNYHVPPRALANTVAITLPWIELLAGGLLIAGVWKRASAWVITAMMVVFLVAIAWALAHGYDIRCGCFGTVEARKVGVLALGEDFVLLAMAAWLAWRLENSTNRTTETTNETKNRRD
ncbi:MAG TPA: MauE/DoxX family redox-associated membrane protein [Verrucomicrobiae bacterium]|nr:MauE/DoxX family redox-associated membrane protein [Verrucomicrobiae bacterium]